MRRVLILLLVALSILFPTFVCAKIFKWVDGKGNIHVIEKPEPILASRLGSRLADWGLPLTFDKILTERRRNDDRGMLTELNHTLLPRLLLFNI